MSKTIDTFVRYEKKYLLTACQYDSFMSKTRDRFTEDAFARSAISNIYFDTADYLLIRRSLEKPVYKEKLRLRSYSCPRAEDEVFIELKKKFKSVVFKRRARLPLCAAVDYLRYGLRPEGSSQILDEVDWFMHLYPELEARMYIYYDRHSLCGTQEDGLRVTFDRNILWRSEDLLLSAGAYGESLLPEGSTLMEIKIPFAMPLWLAHILDELGIYSTSFSKYGNSYLAMLNSAGGSAKRSSFAAPAVLLGSA